MNSEFIKYSPRVSNSESGKNIIFDICDTMYRENTTFAFLDYSFHGNRKFKLLRRISLNKSSKIINAIIYRIFGLDIIRIIFLRFLKGYNRMQLSEMMRDFYEHDLINSEVSYIINKIDEHKKNGDNVIIVSATLDFIAEYISCIYGVKFLSSTLCYDSDGFCIGHLKKDILGYKLNEISNHIQDIEHVYTDNKSDQDIINVAESCTIVSKGKDLDFWKRKNINHATILLVDEL